LRRRAGRIAKYDSCFPLLAGTYSKIAPNVAAKYTDFILTNSPIRLGHLGGERKKIKKELFAGRNERKYLSKLKRERRVAGYPKVSRE
jgi:hypothetical protein